MEKKSLKFVILIYKKYLFLFILALIGSVLEASSISGFAYILKNVIDDIFIQKNSEMFLIIILALLILIIAKQVGFFLKNFLYPLIIFKYIKNLRTKIYNSILNSDIAYLQKLQIGDLLSRATNDTERLSQMLATLGINLITEIFTTVGIILLLLYLDWKMFLIFVVIVPFLALVLNYFGEKKKKYSKLVQESLSEYTQHLNQILSGLETVKLYKQDIFKRVFRKLNEKLYKREKKNRFYDTVYLNSVEILGYSGAIGIILYGGYRVINNEITTGEFFSFLGGLLVLVNSSQILQRGLVNLKGLSPVIDRVEFILNLPKSRDGKIRFEKLEKEIDYKNLYVEIDGKTILKDINLKIKQKEKIGIVGFSGSGKTTLVKLIPRIIKDYRGSLKIDGIEIKDFKINSLREKIGYLSQEVFIFNDTVRNNLLIAKPDATDEELINALKKAKAEFILKRDNGLDTLLGEKGSNLSGGERQRLAIARLFLKSPEILIIDEGTSALDVETEDKVIREITEHFKDKTVIYITHRFSILDFVDRIVVMDKGVIVEEGSFKELINKKGLFSYLKNL